MCMVHFSFLFFCFLLYYSLYYTLYAFRFTSRFALQVVTLYQLLL